MQKIILLDEKTKAAIAAGEVIDRPASIIKELIENSLDAGADEITIQLEKAGLEEIIVIDNGHGIPKDQLSLALSPHATSKLERFEDLLSISTHGFRGEALASIAAAADIVLISRTKDSDAAYQISSVNDKPTPTAHPVGTKVEIRKLFSFHPVRKEFLKKSKVEFKHIMQVISSFALHHPQVNFSVTHNGRVVLQTQRKQSQLSRYKQILGQRVMASMLPVSHKEDKINITGYVSQNSSGFSNRDNQYVFINNRPVKFSSIHSMMKEGLKGSIDPRKHPAYILQVTMPQELVDVNVHPQKHKVQLFDTKEIKKAITQLIEQVRHARPIAETNFSDERGWMLHDQNNDYGIGKRFRNELGKTYNQKMNAASIVGEIQQLNDLYLLVPTKQGLLIVDQHALHERFLYDELKRTYEESSLKDESITYTAIFDLTVSQSLLFEENLEVFTKLGFDISSFGTYTYKINSIPKIFQDHDIVSFIEEVLEVVANGEEEFIVDTQTDNILANMACRMAVKGGDYLSKEMREKLVKELLETDHTGTCPHGRPVAITISLYELGKLFKRH